MIIASMEEAGSNTVYSYDRDFDRVLSVTRLEP
jgi:predicted nucleic acid-binding protein